jgi:hypothetical protein
MEAATNAVQKTEDQNYGIFRSKFRFDRKIEMMYDAVRHREESKPSNCISYPEMQHVFPRICLPGVCVDDTHINGWFVKQAGLF